jgi:hypothetical protein
MIHPLPAVAIDCNKTGEVRKAFEYGGRRYRGSEDIHPYKDGKVTLKITAKNLGLETDMITAPSSLMKRWQAEGKVVVHGTDFESGNYDCFDIDGTRGYRPWDRPSQGDVQLSGQLPPTEFDDLWLPVTRSMSARAGRR